MYLFFFFLLSEALTVRLQIKSAGKSTPRAQISQETGLIYFIELD